MVAAHPDQARGDAARPAACTASLPSPRRPPAQLPSHPRALPACTASLAPALTKPLLCRHAGTRTSPASPPPPATRRAPRAAFAPRVS
eukprot:3026288-Prymnesium_polylepis.1